MKVELKDAGGASWRARYLYVNGRQVAHIGVDPNHGVKPTCFGSVAGKQFRFGLPWVKWTYPMGPVRSLAYKVASNFWHNMDGRYGWGSKFRKEARS